MIHNVPVVIFFFVNIRVGTKSFIIISKQFMAHNHRIVAPGIKVRTVLSESGEQLTPPADWAFLPAGDAAITRSVKAKGTTWVVQVRKGRRLMSKGVWAKEEHIQTSRKEVRAKRSTPEYEKRRVMDLARREEKHQAYVEEFCIEVANFLKFHPRYHNQEKILAEKVTAHATPVGSGTVARTKQIPIAGRAEAAVIAWMRHQTTAYDSIKIARIKGRRREVRRMLAAKSVEILQAYRQGRKVSQNCALKEALA